VFSMWHVKITLYLLFYISFSSSSFVCKSNCRFSYYPFLNISLQSLQCNFLIMISPMQQTPSNPTDCSNSLSFQNIVTLSHYRKIFLVIPSAVSIMKGFFCSEDGGSMFVWSTGTYLPNCISWYSIRTYLNIHCSVILNSPIFVSKINSADFTIQFNSSFAVRTVTYADILLHWKHAWSL
jgi:hypothetical protein